MKARYELANMNLTVSNVTLRNAADSYVLLKAADDQNNEITIKLSHEQAEFLEAELREVNRRRRENSPDITGNDQERITDDDSFNLFSIDLFNENESK
ncbi:hypothetical protein ABWK46_24200 [Peribacillus frigoritolerans]|jgi:hypothetical protein|uniref:Uncharacterized protein n=1 Tax=Peribacillus castrilensis TaxID=2897690 RepID=A0AAW9NFT5_9BACI|nr:MULTISPECIES: hypothetical protein [Peribacillus]KOR78765.1 hypothetical protein AM232_10020 [Bacillus sp. FJAT-21352]KOR83100.1 hypothetical protein AM233_02480 [Bacillus sp. FJAT-22058]MBL3640986.1 hypothetical protein [Bacillus sp. RHFB]MBT2605019.1 hypothetical protein [Bacillus sp. ISL-53]MCD1161034.1 hypothetical protein [Peribacillus castrilensis]